MSNFVETWKGIATALGRSERWCRYMARRAGDPLVTRKLNFSSGPAALPEVLVHLTPLSAYEELLSDAKGDLS